MAPQGCKCGHLGDPLRPCRCSTPEVQRYRARISGPVPDRLDLEVQVPAVPLADLTGGHPAESSEVVRERVCIARDRQRVRWRSAGVLSNAEARQEWLRDEGMFQAGALDMAARCTEKLHLSARGFHRLLRVARTVADLSAAESVAGAHVAEAAAFRPRVGEQE